MSGSKNHVETILEAIVIKNSRLSIESVSDGDSLVRDLGFDSLAFLMTLTDLEERFQIDFPVEKVGEFQDLSFKTLVRLVMQQLPQASQQC